MASASAEHNIFEALAPTGSFMPEDLQRMQQVFTLLAEKLEIPEDTDEWHALAKQVVEGYDRTAPNQTLFYDVLVAFTKSQGKAKANEGRLY